MTAWQLQATTTMMILTKDNLTFLAVTRRTQRYALLFTQLDRERNRETCRTDELPKDNFARQPEWQRCGRSEGSEHRRFNVATTVKPFRRRDTNPMYSPSVTSPPSTFKGVRCGVAMKNGRKPEMRFLLREVRKLA